MTHSHDSNGTRWACPICEWAHVETSGLSLEEQQAKVDDGWWWCAEGHEQVALVRDDATMRRPVGDRSP